MRSFVEKISLLSLSVFLLAVPAALGAEDLIPPSRTLEGREELPGKLTVVSEPPELEVFLDGSGIGQTPIWLKGVKPGPHTVRIGEEDTDVYVEPGKRVALSFYKGSFIDISKKLEVVKEVAPEPEEVKKPREIPRPAGEEEQEEAARRFERFINEIHDFF